MSTAQDPTWHAPCSSGVILDEDPRQQLRRLALEMQRLRHDAARWQQAGRPETAQELRALMKMLGEMVERIERALLCSGHRDIPTLFDP